MSIGHPPRTTAVAPEDLSVEEMYLLLRDTVIPRPIAWVSTMDPQGRTNLAPFSFFSVCSADPPVVGFSVIGRPFDKATQPMPAKDTLANIRALREMVVNIVPQGLMQAMVETSSPLPPGESEFAAARLVEVASDIVKPPRVGGSPVALECALHGMLELGRDTWVMGRVLRAHVDDRVHLGEVDGQKHRIDLCREESMRPVGRLGRADYVRLTDLATRPRRGGPNQ